MKKTISLVLAYVLLCAMLSGSLSLLQLKGTPVTAPIIIGRAGNLILDAGHGGEDGGAISCDGTPESQINLEITQKLSDLLGFYGQPSVLTRQDDRSLHDQGSNSLRQKKGSDLKNRVKLVESTPNSVLISIHQNIYPDPSCRGTQVFFAPTEGSQPLAEHLQASICAAIQPENHRAAKRIADSVYLMNNVSCPAVLIECGFLSNQSEARLLNSSNYQRKLTSVLVSALISCRGL